MIFVAVVVLWLLAGLAVCGWWSHVPPEDC